jgi:hypothetical protein
MRRTLIASAALSLAALGTAQQQLLLPFHHHLSEQLGQSGGSSSYFRTTAGRFQVLYDAPSFLAAGVTGPIVIEKLRFRGEDTEQNHGGQVYSNVTVQLGTTSLSATNATWSTTWATNWAPALPNTTTAGAVGTIPSLVVQPSLGTAPNNYNIEIDLVAAGATITYDPTSAEPSLLIEIIMPTAPTFTIGTALGMILMQDTTGSTAGFLTGSCRTSATVGGTTGTTVNPPVINVEFSGAGGHASLIPARIASYGAACGGSPSTFYQVWAHNEAFDLANSTLTLTPDNAAAPNFYTVAAGGPAFDPTQVNAAPNSTADDAVVTFALGYTFNYPGGSTSTIKPSTNGFVWLDSAQTSSDGSPTVLEFLGNTSTTPHTARLAALWHDLHAGRNTVSHPGSGMHVLNDTSGGPGNTVTYVTYANVGRFNTQSANGGHAVINLQIVMHEATGVVEFRYGSMPTLTGGALSGQAVHAITGFTRGRIAGVNSVDPQSRDLSVEVPFSTAIEGAAGNMGIVPVQAATLPTGQAGRMFQGQSITWNAVNVPAGSLVGAQLLDGGASMPGFQMPSITAPGCMLSTTTGATIWEITFFPPATTVGTVPLPIPAGYNPSLMGANIYAQFVTLDGLFTGGDLISSASNALVHTIGLQ